MPVSTSALTLPQYAIMSNDPLVMRITFSLLKYGSVLADIPMLPKKSMLANGVRWQDNLPAVNWAKLNTDPVVTSGTPTPFQEQAYLIRNAIDVDRKLVEDENQIVDPRGAQIEAFFEAVTYDINDKFINNNHVSGQSDSFVGIRARLDDPATYGTLSELKINGGGVDLTQGGMSAASANTFIELVQNMLDYMGAEDGENVVFYCNDLLRRRWERAIRLLGAGAGFTMLEDAFGRKVTTYRGAKIRIIGRKADQTTQIITSTETAAGADGASTFTSLYAARFDTEHLFGWHYEPLQAEDIGLIGNGGTVYRTIVDYAFGLYMQHTRSISRVYNIKVA